MVLWEITLATAYFLGLKRTYRLALKIQRRVVGPKHPKIRGFLHRQTRNIFDVAVSVHKKVQERDLEVGRNLGNWILRWLDRMKPSAEIRTSPPKNPPVTNNTRKHITSSGQTSGGNQGSSVKFTDQGSNNGCSFSARLEMRPKPFPGIGRIMQQLKPSGMSGQYRHLSCSGVLNFRNGGFGGVFRRDIAQWMLQK